MNRETVESRYEVVRGVIQSRDEFSGHPVYAPYYWDCVQAQHHVEEQPEGPGRITLVIAAQDREEYPELLGYRYVHVTWQDGKFTSCTASNRPAP